MIRKQLRSLFRIYADFEAALVEKNVADVSTGLINQEFEKHLANPPKIFTKASISVNFVVHRYLQMIGR